MLITGIIIFKDVDKEMLVLGENYLKSICYPYMKEFGDLINEEGS